MTLSTETSRNDYVGTGATSVYPYTFKIFADTDLLVTQRDTADVETTLVLNVDYTVSGVGDAAGGNVTLLGGNLATGFALAIRRVLPVKQLTDIRNQGAYFRDVHEDTFDTGRMVDQQQQDEIDRSVKLPESVGSAAVDPTLPVPSAKEFIRWNSTADALESAAAVAGSGTILFVGGNGMMARTDTAELTARSIIGGTGITVVNGDGQAGNPTINLDIGVDVDRADASAATSFITIDSDVRANISASDKTGEHAFDTTINILFRSDGTNWVPVARGIRAIAGENISKGHALIHSNATIGEVLKHNTGATTNLPGRFAGFAAETVLASAQIVVLTDGYGEALVDAATTKGQMLMRSITTAGQVRPASAVLADDVLAVAVADQASPGSLVKCQIRSGAVFLKQDLIDALRGAAAPAASNVFATIADVPANVFDRVEVTTLNWTDVGAASANQVIDTSNATGLDITPILMLVTVGVRLRDISEGVTQYIKYAFGSAHGAAAGDNIGLRYDVDTQVAGGTNDGLPDAQGNYLVRINSTGGSLINASLLCTKFDGTSIELSWNANAGAASDERETHMAITIIGKAAGA